MSSTPTERKDHCLKEHKFPNNFRFDQSVKIASKTTQMEVTDDDEIVGKPQVPKFKPFHFGCGGGHKTFMHSSKPRPDPMESMVVDLKESLPEF